MSEHEHKTRTETREGYRLGCWSLRCVAHSFTEERKVCRRKRRCGWATEWQEVSDHCIHSLTMDSPTWQRLRRERTIYV